MFNVISNALKKPRLYEKTAVEFWDDPYISKQMLTAHLNPDLEAASRKLRFIEDSVDWIKKLLPPAIYPSLLDLGCGPGLYTERFCQSGYQVTGLDFSKRSIEYAKNSAIQKDLDITYLYEDYLTMNLNKQFDLITMIYCDYGALSQDDRQHLLATMYQLLKPNAKLLLDVFSLEQYNCLEECQTWESCPNGGFWSEEGYVTLKGQYKYTDCVTLRQYSVLTKKNLTNYYIWDTYFTKETLAKEAIEAGFKVYNVYSDVKGTPYHDKHLTLAILLEK